MKRGVWQAGGLPLEFPTISLGETFLSPTDVFAQKSHGHGHRGDVVHRAQPIDGVVLLGGCDKTLPAQLMGAASADVPAIVVTAGPMLSGRYDHQHLGACPDCRRFWVEHRAGTLSREELDVIEGALCPSTGHCMVMGTASTMASLTEALGMALPGMCSYPHPLSERMRMAETSGRRIVGMVRERPQTFTYSEP